MADHYDIYDNSKNIVVTDFELLKDAELWVIEQDHPENFEVIPVEVHKCSSPMNLFLDNSGLTRNKK